MIRHNRLPFLVVLGAIILFCLLYFGARTKPLNRASIDKTRSLKAQSTVSSSKLIESAKESLDTDALTSVTTLEKELKAAANSTQKLEILKKISGKWYQLSNFAVSASYAEQIAQQTGQEEGWARVGTCPPLLPRPKVRGSYLSSRGRLTSEPLGWLYRT